MVFLVSLLWLFEEFFFTSTVVAVLLRQMLSTQKKLVSSMFFFQVNFIFDCVCGLGLVQKF